MTFIGVRVIRNSILLYIEFPIRLTVPCEFMTTFIKKMNHIKGLSDAEINDKFMWMSSNRLDPDQARAVMDAVWSLETCAELASFMEMLHTMCGD